MKKFALVCAVLGCLAFAGAETANAAHGSRRGNRSDFRRADEHGHHHARADHHRRSNGNKSNWRRNDFRRNDRFDTRWNQRNDTWRFRGNRRPYNNYRNDRGFRIFTPGFNFWYGR